jgi:hypothetical protein
VIPRHIVYSIQDPFDGRVLLSGSIPYDKRVGSTGAYSRLLRGLRDNANLYAGRTLEGRKARLRIAIPTWGLDKESA